MKNSSSPALQLELTWIGKGHRPKLEPRILLEEPATNEVGDIFDNRLIHGENMLRLKAQGQEFALTLEGVLARQKQIKAIEAQRNEKRRSLFEVQDAIDQQRENLIKLIEGKLLQKIRLEPLFHHAWRIN